MVDYQEPKFDDQETMRSHANLIIDVADDNLTN